MPRTRPMSPVQTLSRVFDRTSRRYEPHGILALRLALGVVYVWFGVLKFFNGVSPAAKLATDTMSVMTFHTVPVSVSRPLLALMETLIGVGFLSGRLRRLLGAVFLAQVLGALSSLALAHNEVWKTAPYLPNLTGQYVIKDLILLTAGLVVLTAPRQIPGPVVSQEAFDYLASAAHQYSGKRRTEDFPATSSTDQHLP